MLNDHKRRARIRRTVVKKSLQCFEAACRRSDCNDKSWKRRTRDAHSTFTQLWGDVRLGGGMATRCSSFLLQGPLRGLQAVS